MSSDTPARSVLETRNAISHARRDQWVSLAVRVFLFAGVVGGFVLVSAERVIAGGLLMAGVLAVSFMMASRNVRSQQQVGRASALIGAGHFDGAEQELTEAMNTFNLYRAPRLGLLQNLAALRHAQRRFRDASQLATELLRYRPTDVSVRRTLLLMQAECGLEMNDLQSVHQALSGISAPLPVREMLKMTELQIEFYVRTGAYVQALEQLPAKVELAELLPADSAARMQAMLAISAKRLNRDEWMRWLRRRVELLTDIPSLLGSRPGLKELWE